LITQSVDNIVVATDAAFSKALLVTSRGSIIPDLIIFTIFPVTTFNPLPLTLGSSYSTIPAFSNIVLNGALIASSKTSSPFDFGFIKLDAFKRAIPPPGTIPSFIAAFVAQIASSTLSFFSFNSTSELAPILLQLLL
jgi:hypothetical protein